MELRYFRVVKVKDHPTNPEKKIYVPSAQGTVFEHRKEDGTSAPIKEATLKAVFSCIKLEILGEEYKIYLNDKRPAKAPADDDCPI